MLIKLVPFEFPLYHPGSPNNIKEDGTSVRVLWNSSCRSSMNCCILLLNRGIAVYFARLLGTRGVVIGGYRMT